VIIKNYVKWMANENITKKELKLRILIVKNKNNIKNNKTTK